MVGALDTLDICPKQYLLQLTAGAASGRATSDTQTCFYINCRSIRLHLNLVPDCRSILWGFLVRWARWTSPAGSTCCNQPPARRLAGKTSFAMPAFLFSETQINTAAVVGAPDVLDISSGQYLLQSSAVAGFRFPGRNPVSFSLPGQFPMQINPLAVVGALDTLDISPGQYLLQSAAGSAFGRMMISLAKSRGIRTINVVRRAEQVPELLALGSGSPHILFASVSFLKSECQFQQRVRGIRTANVVHHAKQVSELLAFG